MSVEEKNNSEGKLVKRNYSNGQLAVFYRNFGEEPIAELSINDDLVDLETNEIILKNYSENKILASQLLKKKIIIPTYRYILIGSHLCPVCRVTF